MSFPIVFTILSISIYKVFSLKNIDYTTKEIITQLASFVKNKILEFNSLKGGPTSQTFPIGLCWWTHSQKAAHCFQAKDFESA